jgi:molybdenum cofactor synthesis domain-containing protein
MSNIKVLSVSKASERGIKNKVEQIQLDENGVVGDVHAGSSRPISIIDQYHIDKFQEHTNARETRAGEFAENIRIEGLENTDVKIFDCFRISDTELEVVQKGKAFHQNFKELGNYVMPRVGVFCRTKKGGIIKAGDEIEYFPKTFKIFILTLSDRASKGEYEDKSGPETARLSTEVFEKKNFKYQVDQEIIPDDAELLTKKIQKAIEKNVDLIITTGGTGIGKRDITVDTIKPLLDKEVPGVMEMIRIKYGMQKSNALLSRSIAGVIGETLVYTLPGSVKAVREYMSEINNTLYHLICMLHGIDAHS